MKKDICKIMIFGMFFRPFHPWFHTGYPSRVPASPHFMNTVKAALIFACFLPEDPSCFSGGSLVLGSPFNLASFGGNQWATWLGGAELLVYNLMFCPFILKVFSVSWQF